MNNEKQLKLFDTIHRKTKTASSSTWEGDKGTYFFKSTGKWEASFSCLVKSELFHRAR